MAFAIAAAAACSEGTPEPTPTAEVALTPVRAELAGHEVVIEAFLSPSATVIRFEVPETPFVQVPAPTLRAGDSTIPPILSEQTGRHTEHRYGPVESNERLTLTFDGVVVREPIEPPWTIELALDAPGIAPWSSDPNVVERRELRWQVESADDAPVVRSVALERVHEVRLEISLDGTSWQPGPTPPVVIGDGEELDVVGAGTSSPVAGPPESRISVRLGDRPVPRELSVGASEQEVTLPPTGVVLRP